MFHNKGIERKFYALLKGDRIDLLPTFFSYWRDGDELADKVLLWGHYFLDHYFREGSPAFHRELIKAYFSKQNCYCAAPRGFSKTTLLQACTDFSIVNKMDKFIVFIEKTFTEAAEVIKGIHDEFIDNEKILVVYGDLLTNENKTVRDLHNLTQKRVRPLEQRGDVFINGVRIRGKGFNSAIRGLKTREWRPTRIILDDVEEDEHINNPEQRLKYKNNFNKGVQPAVDIVGSIKVFGTILHQDSLLKNLIDNRSGQIFRAYNPEDPANTLLWPERWPLSRLNKKKEEMGNQAFAQEYLNDPVSEEDRSFKFNWLWEMLPDPIVKEATYRVPRQRITFAEFEKKRRETTLAGYAMIDVADATTAQADYTGVIVHFATPENIRYRADVRREKRNIKGVIDLIFEIWEKWAPYGLVKIGIEKKGYNDQIVPLFEEEKRRRQVYPIIEELKPMGRNKQNRIKGALQGLYEMEKIISLGKINDEGKFEAVGDTETLLNELYDFPSAKHDDLSDAEAYGADIIVVPLADEATPKRHRSPVDDPFEAGQDQNDLTNNFVGSHHEGDPFD